jgi:hypothetical protein
MSDAPSTTRPDTVVAVYVETDAARAEPGRPVVGGEWEVHSDGTVTHLKAAEPGDELPQGPKGKPVGPRRSRSVFSAAAFEGDPVHYVRVH